MLDVTAAIIMKDDTVFIAKKGEGRFAHKWEFPGGKIEDGELPEACVVREIFEEFGIEVKVAGYFTESIHTFPEGQIRIFAYFCEWVSGDIVPTEHEDYKWAPVRALHTFEFAPADIPLAKKLMSWHE